MLDLRRLCLIQVVRKAPTFAGEQRAKLDDVPGKRYGHDLVPKSTVSRSQLS